MTQNTFMTTYSTELSFTYIHIICIMYTFCADFLSFQTKGATIGGMRIVLVERRANTLALTTKYYSFSIIFYGILINKYVFFLQNPIKFKRILD